MSIFTYLSFPRKADLSMIQSNFDMEKCYSFGQIKGTALEQELPFDISGMPDDLHYYFGDRTDLYGVEIKEADSSTLKLPLENPFIYSIAGEFEYARQRVLSSGLCALEHEEEFADRIASELDDNVDICRRQLYDVVVNNLRIGEYIELFSWDCMDPSAVVTGQVNLNAADIMASHKLAIRNGLNIHLFL